MVSSPGWWVVLALALGAGCREKGAAPAPGESASASEPAGRSAAAGAWVYVGVARGRGPVGAIRESTDPVLGKHGYRTVEVMDQATGESVKLSLLLAPRNQVPLPFDVGDIIAFETTQRPCGPSTMTDLVYWPA